MGELSRFQGTCGDVHTCTSRYSHSWLHILFNVECMPSTLSQHHCPFLFLVYTVKIQGADEISRENLEPLAPMDVPYGHPYIKWVSNGNVSASNKAPICETYFGLQQRHNPNMSILSPRDSFVERVIFWVILLEKTKNRYGTLYL